MKIQSKNVVSAQVLKIEFVKSENSYLLHFLETVDGGYEHYDSWTNNALVPEFSIGQSVLLVPIRGSDGKTRYTPLPA